MLDSIRGISRKTFLKENVLPANHDDKFNDNKCAYCWGPYDKDHPAIRVLPCNHVFGHECLLLMTEAPNGGHCPICRASFFRPPLRRLLLDRLQQLLFYIFTSIILVGIMFITFILVILVAKIGSVIYKLANSFVNFTTCPE
jgi:hypothetical protein